MSKQAPTFRMNEEAEALLEKTERALMHEDHALAPILLNCTRALCFAIAEHGAVLSYGLDEKLEHLTQHLKMIDETLEAEGNRIAAAIARGRAEIE